MVISLYGMLIATSDFSQRPITPICSSINEVLIAYQPTVLEGGQDTHSVECLQTKTLTYTYTNFLQT